MTLWNTISQLSPTDYLMLGGITVIVYVLIRANRKEKDKLINLKSLKVLPSK